MDAKKYLIEMLDYYKKRLQNDSCTMEEINSAAKALEENMKVYGTIGDIAEHYGKSKDAVNSVIKNRLIEKPKRNVVLYPFHAFAKIIPDSWRKKH